MIKPATLWGLMKTCDDSKWIGDICRSLGGQEVELDYGQRQMVNSIQLDSGWLDEAVEAQRAKWREKKRGQRGTFETNGEKGEMSPVPECPPPSVLPSIHPSIQSNNTVCESVEAPARAGGVHPDLKTVVGAAPQMGVPEWYAKWWFDNCEASGWVKTNGSPIDNGNWRAVLKAWWNRADEKEKDRIQGERKRAQELAPRKLTAADWVLCEERCALFTDGRCHGGCIMPPDKRPHPIPPEECQSFRKGG